MGENPAGLQVCVAIRAPEDVVADLPEAVNNTLVIAQRCHYLLKSINPILPPFKTDDGRSETEEIGVQAATGLEWRLENFV